jgi:hypothetical protein
MKKMTVILVFILLFYSCARKFDISSAFRKGIPADMQQLVLDSSFHLYIREVFLDTAVAGDKAVQNNDTSFTDKGQLIEVEYLLFSVLKKQAVYISTIPDKYLQYYTKKIKYLPRAYLNAYDFSTFRFGKKIDNSNAIVFENTQTKKNDTWKYTMEKDSILHVYEVIERMNADAATVYLADEALSRAATFIQMDSFRIAFRNMDKEKKTDHKKGRPPLQRFCKDNTIYFRKEANRYRVYFRFNRTLPTRYKDSAISFGNARLVNQPFSY